MYNVMAGRWCKLYRDITPGELKAEEAIGALGVPYRFQFPGFLYSFRYYPDFLLPTLRTIVEVDDPSHNEAEKRKTDEQRTQELNALGYTVVRITNSEALGGYCSSILRERLRSARIDWKRPVCSLAEGLPPKPDKNRRKKTRGEVRQLRLAKKAPIPNPIAPAGKSYSQPAVN